MAKKENIVEKNKNKNENENDKSNSRDILQNITKNKNTFKGLGKGLGALIREDLEKDDAGHIVTSKKDNKQNNEVDFDNNGNNLIDIDQIITNPFQPRKEFNEDALEDLKNSILQHGVIQPISVRKALNGYELIAGERRLRASIKAGLKKIPAYVLDVRTGTEMLEIAIIENVQRENLNPIEVAYGYQRLIEECNFTQEQVAIKMGKNRSTVTNFLRLIKLPEKIKNYIRNNKISFGHARALLSLDSDDIMLKVVEEVIDNELSVRATETYIKNYDSIQKDLLNEKKNKDLNKNKSENKSEIKNNTLNPIIIDLEDRLRHIFGTEVKIKSKTNESGSIEIDFYSKDDLDRLIEMWGKLEL